MFSSGLQYGFFLMVLIIAQIVVAALVFIYVGDAKAAFKKGFARLFDERDRPQNAELIDTIQANVSSTRFISLFLILKYPIFLPF